MCGSYPFVFFPPLSELKKAMFMLKDRFLKHMEITGSTWLIESLHSAWNLKFSMESLDLLLLKEQSPAFCKLAIHTV